VPETPQGEELKKWDHPLSKRGGAGGGRLVPSQSGYRGGRPLCDTLNVRGGMEEVWAWGGWGGGRAPLGEYPGGDERRRR